MDNPRFEDESMQPLRMPDKKTIQCTDCVYRQKDQKFPNGVLEGAISGTCEVYDIKPPSILWNGAECPYYLGKDEE